MIMLSMENNFENKRFGEMFWNNWITGISNLIESNSYYFEYEKINTMFEMSLMWLGFTQITTNPQNKNNYEML